jgi:hypothetical protein
MRYQLRVGLTSFCLGRATAYAVSCRLLSAESRVRFQVSLHCLRFISIIIVPSPLQIHSCII